MLKEHKLVPSVGNSEIVIPSQGINLRIILSLILEYHSLIAVFPFAHKVNGNRTSCGQKQHAEAERIHLLQTVGTFFKSSKCSQEVSPAEPSFLPQIKGNQCSKHKCLPCLLI